MDMELTTLLIGIGVILVIFWLFRRPSRNLPPCPSRPLPIVGNIFSLEADPRPQFKKWHKELGDIFCLHMGGTLFVVLNGFPLNKEVLVKRADEFSDRPWFYFDLVTDSPGKGISFGNGKNWKEQRSVTLSILRDFGMGKNVLAEKIQSEVVFYIDSINRLDGQATDMRPLTNMSMANMICAFIVGERFDYEDATFKDLTMKFRDLVEDLTTNSLINYFPILGKLPGDLFGAKRIASSMRHLVRFFKKEFITKHNHDETSNFVAAYLAQRDKKLKDGEPTEMDEDNLVKIVLELFFSGADTTSTSILWCYLYALNHLDVQEKIYKEIEEEIGTDRDPTMQDRTKLVYLNAFINEVARLSTIAAHSFAHTNPVDAEIRGYTIPKGSFIIPNLDSIHFDKTIWGNDVMEFKPERFIDGSGKLKNPEELVPFGIGRRNCIGESMTKMIQFLLLASLFQKFKVVAPDPAAPPPIKYYFTVDAAPVPFQVRFVDRRKN